MNNYFENGKLKLKFINEFIDKYIRPQTNNIISTDENIIIIYPENFKYPDYISNKYFNHFIGFMTEEQKSEMIENLMEQEQNETLLFLNDEKDEYNFSKYFYNQLFEQMYVNICIYSNRIIKTIGINELK